MSDMRSGTAACYEAYAAIHDAALGAGGDIHAWRLVCRDICHITYARTRGLSLLLPGGGEAGEGEAGEAGRCIGATLVKFPALQRVHVHGAAWVDVRAHGARLARMSVHTLGIDRAPPGDAVISLIRLWRASLRRVVLREDAGDRALRALGCCAALRALSLRDTRVVDLSPLAPCTALEVLELEGTPIEDLSPLPAFAALKTLDLRGTQVADLSPLRACTSLQVLHLDHTRVDDLSPLAACAALQRLELASNAGVVALAPLASCTALRLLNVSATGVADVSALRACALLRELNICFTEVTDVTELAAWPALRLLYIGGPARLRGLSALERAGKTCEYWIWDP